MVSVYQSEEVPLPGSLNGELMVCVCQLVENLGCPLCCRAPVFHMWVPLPFRMPLLMTLVVFRNTQCPGSTEGRIHQTMGSSVQTCI